MNNNANGNNNAHVTPPHPPRPPRPPPSSSSSSAARTPSRKRPREASSAADENSVVTTSERNVRPRLAPVVLLDTTSGTGGGGDGGDFNQLSVHGARARLRYVRWCTSAQRERRRCFLCEFDKHYYTLELSRGGDQALFMVVTYGYDLLLRFYAEHHTDDPRELSEGLNEIYNVHIRDPSRVTAAGRRLATMYPEQTPEDFLMHIEAHNHDPEYLANKNMRLVQDVIAFFSSDAALFNPETGRPDVNTGKLLLQAAALNDRLISARQRTQASGGGAARALRIDPNKVFSIASTRPLEAFQRQAMDALGGATASNTDLVTESSAAQRPDMGRFVDEEEEEEEEQVQDDDRDGMEPDQENQDAIDEFLRHGDESLPSQEDDDEEE